MRIATTALLFTVTVVPLKTASARIAIAVRKGSITLACEALVKDDAKVRYYPGGGSLTKKDLTEATDSRLKAQGMHEGPASVADEEDMMLGGSDALPSGGGQGDLLSGPLISEAVLIDLGGLGSSASEVAFPNGPLIQEDDIFPEPLDSAFNVGEDFGLSLPLTDDALVITIPQGHKWKHRHDQDYGPPCGTCRWCNDCARKFQRLDVYQHLYNLAIQHIATMAGSIKENAHEIARASGRANLVVVNMKTEIDKIHGANTSWTGTHWKHQGWNYVTDPAGTPPGDFSTGPWISAPGELTRLQNALDTDPYVKHLRAVGEAFEVPGRTPRCPLVILFCWGMR